MSVSPFDQQLRDAVRSVLDERRFPVYQEKRCLTIAEASGYLGYSVRTVEELVERGELATVTLDPNARKKTRRITIEELDRWIREHTDGKKT